MKTKSRFELIKEFKQDIKDYYLYNDNFTEEELNDIDTHELAQSQLSVYYAGLIEQANELEGDEWRQVWLNPSELRAENCSPYDTLMDNLYILYIELYSEAIYELIQELKQTV